MSGIIPQWANDMAERVMTMFPRGDTDRIDRDLLHGAFAAALVETRERCAITAEQRGKELGEPAVGSDIANTIRDAA